MYRSVYTTILPLVNLQFFPKTIFWVGPQIFTCFIINLDTMLVYDNYVHGAGIANTLSVTINNNTFSWYQGSSVFYQMNYKDYNYIGLL